jgi:6-phosphogluconolactonase
MLMTPEILVLESPEAVAERAAADFAQLVEETLANKDRFTVALPGGVTPKMFFTRLTQEPFRDRIPWKKLWIFWGDERCVPPDHQESNYGVARDLLLQQVPIPGSQVFRMRGEDPPPESARAYAKTLHDFFKAAEGWPVFDLIILGLGPDGHTASLIPGTAAVQEERRWVVENVVRSLQTVRITLTLPVINHAANVWFMVTGVKKVAALAKARSGPSLESPASLVQPEQGRLVWYVDRAALGEIPEGQSAEVRKKL